MNLIIDDKKYKILDCGQLKKLNFCQFHQTNNAHGKIIYNLTLQEENNFCLKICKQTIIIQRVHFVIIQRVSFCSSLFIDLIFTLRVEKHF